MSGSLLRYNAYTGIRNAGVIRVRELRGPSAIPRLQVARDFILAKVATLGGSGRGERQGQVPAAGAQGVRPDGCGKDPGLGR